MPIVSREILNHPDFCDGFEKSLIAYLESVMDDEFAKDDADFDLIDACAEAVNAIRSGETAELFSLISYEQLSKKIGRNKNRAGIVVTAAVCAVVAIIGFAGTQIHTGDSTTAVQYVAQKLNEIFDKDISAPEETTEPSTAKAEKPSAQNIPVVSEIIVKTDKSFKEEYEVGEKFNGSGISVDALYSDGSVKPAEYEISVPDSFASRAGFDTVTVMSGKFKKEIQIRIIDTVKTVKLNSIYASFPEDFGFTATDIYNIDYSEMEVYAVYSNGTESELKPGQYETNTDYITKESGKKALVTLTYEGTSCSFIISQEKEEA